MKKPYCLMLLCAALALLFTLTGAGPACAEVVHLKTGETVKGRIIVEETNEEVLVFHDMVRGSVRRLRWDAVDTEERDRINRLLGRDNTVQKTLMGDVLIQKLADGSTEEIRGKIESEDASTISIRSNGQLLKVPLAQVVDRRKEEMDRRDVYSPAALWEQYLAELKANNDITDLDSADARTKFKAAEFAQWCDMLPRALELYEAAAAEPGYLNAKVAAQRAKVVAELIRDAEALRALKHMRMLLAYRNFRKFKVAEKAFAENHPEVGEAVSVRLTRLQAEFERKRNDYFRGQAKYHFPRIAERLIEKKVKEKDITVTDVTSWTRRELPEEAFEKLADRFGKKDDLTPEEAQAFWEQRKKRNWTVRSYGAGTFVVKPAKVKPPTKKRRSGGSRSGGQAAPKLKTPKPPTRDQWWSRAKARERTTWAMAYFAERSGLFELGDEKFYPCKLCNGSGYQSKALQSGGLFRWICTRCAGTKNDWGVKFR